MLQNVKPHLERDSQSQLTRSELAEKIREFAGPSPEFWAYFSSYDWVVLCQLYGPMMELPKGWPMFCRDLKQLMVEAAPNTTWVSPEDEHHALSDARWVRDVHRALTVLKEGA